METTTEKTSLKIKKYLELLIYQALKEDLPFAVWKKPKQNLVEIIVDDQPHRNDSSMDLDALPPGFIIHPFLKSENREGTFIKATKYFRFELEQETIEISDFLESEESPYPSEQAKSLIKKKIFQKDQGFNQKASEKKAFLEMVKLAIDAVKSGEMYKVVPAKVKKTKLDPNFDLAHTFIQLCDAYPNGFVNCFHTPRTGFWIGSSPETLIKTKADQFYTMSLAGTQKAKGNNPLKNTAWTQKEIGEQALVSRYIVNCFKKIRLREYEEIGPKTTIAGGLLHLKSEFLVDMKATNFPQLGTIMLDLLHPTSAICGMPKEKALAFIKAQESFDRSYFAGFIGPVNMGGETDIFVNLRCAKLEGGNAWLYAGAGITEDSVPEKEWEETELKCKIIGNFIHSKKRP